MKQENQPSALTKTIRFLADNDALEPAASPWPTYSDDDAVAQVNYSDVMRDPRENERSPWELPGHFFESIDRILGQRGEDDPLSGSALPAAKSSEAIWDTCAWYQPIHFYPYDWGIYIKEDCLLQLAVALARSTDRTAFQRERALPASPRPAHWRLSDAEIFARAAFVLLFLHEHYHHRIECLGIRLHVVTRSGLYVPYTKKIYGPAKGTDNLLEEALANACMYLRLDEKAYHKCLPAAVRDAMKALLKRRFPHEPPGYRQAVKYLDKVSFDNGENRLQGWVRETSMTPAQPLGDWDAAPRMTQSFLNIQSSIYTIVPRGARSVLPSSGFPLSCSTAEMVGLCKRNGYKEVVGAGKGSHIKMSKTGAAPVILPQRKDLSIGVIKNTLSALGGYRLKDLPRLLAA